MRICKVKGCDRKRRTKGYCMLHSSRKKIGNPLIKICKYCGRNITNKKGYPVCKRCSKKKKSEAEKKYAETHIFFQIAGQRGNVYTNGVTEEMKEMLPKIKDKVLKDAIRNPAHYLYGDKKKKK